MNKPILCSVDSSTGVWTDDQGRKWVPAPTILPDTDRAVILWENGAYLPQVAIRDERHGWRFNRDERDPRWLTETEMQAEIGNAIWEEYVPISRRVPPIH